MFTNGQPPPDAKDVVWQAWCWDEAVAAGARPPVRWFPAEEAPPPAPPTAAEVAQALYARMQGNMPTPVVATTPPAGVGAIVGVPVFVSVTNWQNELVETGDMGGATVTVRATPQLVVDPGDGGPPAQCAGPGRLYDPAAGDLWDQAGLGDACTIAYSQRTGVAGRPGEWPSTVTVKWSISWSATSGESGTFPTVDRPVSIPRAVDEVRSVVVSEGSQG